VSSARARVVVYAIVFVAFVDVFAMLPTVAPYAASLGAGIVGVGVTVGAYSATNLVFNLVGGVLLDRRGRRRVLLWGLALAAGSMLLYAAAATPGQLIAVRLVHGVAGGLLVPAVFTLAGDLAPAQGRGRVMGRVGATIGAAAVVAPGLAGALRQAVGFTPVFLTVSALTAAGFLLVLVALREPDVEPGRQREASLGVLLRRRGLQVAFVAVAGFTFAVGALAAFLPLHAEALTGSPAVTGALFTLYAVVAALVMLSRLSGAVDLRGPLRPLSVGLLVLGGAMGLLATTPAVALTWVAAGVFGLGYGLVFPAGAGFLAAASSPPERGRAFGLFNAFFSLGLVVGPTLSGLLAAASPASPFLPAVAVCAAAAAFTLVSRRSLAQG
jgi:MFS transporter, DHA1 family, multidrug resistance protein